MEQIQKLVVVNIQFIKKIHIHSMETVPSLRANSKFINMKQVKTYFKAIFSPRLPQIPPDQFLLQNSQRIFLISLLHCKFKAIEHQLPTNLCCRAHYHINDQRRSVHITCWIWCGSGVVVFKGSNLWIVFKPINLQPIIQRTIF